MIKTENCLEYSLSQKQSHVLTLRLQRSLKLLQLSAVELNLALNEISERNPFLDIKQNFESLSSIPVTTFICSGRSEEGCGVILSTMVLGQVTY